MLDRDFGTYRLIRRLGRGGVADVYLARNSATGAEVALKLVEQKPDRESREVCEAERRGAILQQQFSLVDGHVPQVHGCWSIDGFFCIDMEYVDGEDLADADRARPARAGRSGMDGRRNLRLPAKRRTRSRRSSTTPTCAGIIHGDIKPKNVRLNSAGRVKVLDFGIAKGLALSRKLTRNDFGSLAYLSPERLDSGDVDVHVDFWSVGVLLYEMLAGAPPFEAETNSKLEALIRRREPPPPLPEDLPAGAGAHRPQDAGRRPPPALPVRGRHAERPRGVSRCAPRRAPTASGWPRPKRSDAANDAVRRGRAGRCRSHSPHRSRGRAGCGQRRYAADPASGDALPRPVTGDATRPRSCRRPHRSCRRPRRRRPSRRRRSPPVPLPAGGRAASGGDAKPRDGRRPLGGRRGAGRGHRRGRERGHRVERGPGTAREASRPARAPSCAGHLEALPGPVAAKPARHRPGGRARAAQGTPARAGRPRDRRLPAGRADGARSAVAERRDVADRRAAPRPGRSGRHGAPAATARASCSASTARRGGARSSRRRSRCTTRWRDSRRRHASTRGGPTRTSASRAPTSTASTTSTRRSRRCERPSSAATGRATGNSCSSPTATACRADRMRREAAAARGREQERACLKKAADDYTQAIDIYGKAIGFGEASTAMRQSQARRDEVRRRLDDSSQAQVEGTCHMIHSTAGERARGGAKTRRRHGRLARARSACSRRRSLTIGRPVARSRPRASSLAAADERPSPPARSSTSTAVDRERALVGAAPNAIIADDGERRFVAEPPRRLAQHAGRVGQPAPAVAPGRRRARARITVTERDLPATPRLPSFAERFAERRDQLASNPEALEVRVPLLTAVAARAAARRRVVVRTPGEYRRSLLRGPASSCSPSTSRTPGSASGRSPAIALLLPIIHAAVRHRPRHDGRPPRPAARRRCCSSGSRRASAVGCVVLAAVSTIDFQRSIVRRLSYVPLLGAVLALAAADRLRQRPRHERRQGEPDRRPAGRGDPRAGRAVPRRLLREPLGVPARAQGAADRRRPRLRLDIPRLDYLLPVVIGMALVLLFFFLQKDLGPALVLACVFLALYGVARGRTTMVARRPAGAGRRLRGRLRLGYPAHRRAARADVVVALGQPGAGRRSGGARAVGARHRAPSPAPASAWATRASCPPATPT